MQTRKKNKILISVIAIYALIIGLFIAMPKGLDDIYYQNYIADSLCLVVSIVLLLRLYFINQLDIFEPITIIAAVYIMMYFFTPIYDICVGELRWFGYDLFQYGVKATLIEFVGFLVFYICYTKCFKLGHSRRLQYIASDKDIDYVPLSASIPLILIMYAFCFAANVYYLARYNGNGILYLLTLGIVGSGGTVQTTEAPIGFISMFSYSLPAITLLYWEFGKSKALKVILFIPMLMLQVARGFRFFVIQIAITFFAYYFIRNNKRPKLSSIVGAVLVVMVPILIMTLSRNSIRAGSGIDISGLNISVLQEAVEAAIWDNFRIYQNFYGMVHVIPSQYPYVFGRQMILGTIFMIIPRIIWSEKLSSYGGYGLTTLIGKRIESGQAYPNIGEYYYAGGIVGVILCMGIYSIYMKYVRDRFMYSKNAFDVITYSVLLGANLQLIIRGYMPSNFWYVVFAILPVWIVRRFGSREVKCRWEI